MRATAKIRSALVGGDPVEKVRDKVEELFAREHQLDKQITAHLRTLQSADSLDDQSDKDPTKIADHILKTRHTLEKLKVEIGVIRTRRRRELEGFYKLQAESLRARAQGLQTQLGEHRQNVERLLDQICKLEEAPLVLATGRLSPTGSVIPLPAERRSTQLEKEIVALFSRAALIEGKQFDGGEIEAHSVDQLLSALDDPLRLSPSPHAIHEWAQSAQQAYDELVRKTILSIHAGERSRMFHLAWRGGEIDREKSCASPAGPVGGQAA